jgi:hypothetical protein
MNANIKKNKETQSFVNINEISELFKRMNLDTPEKRNNYLFVSEKKAQYNYTIGYSSTTGGPIKDA